MSMAINTSTRLHQVKAYLLNYITQNQLKRNDQLPSETSIAKKLGVSRNTLREAYISLENEGIIVRRHGIGTFVAHSPVIRDSLNNFSPFAQIIQDSGYTPNFQTLSMSFEHAPADVYDVFGTLSSEKLRHIKRIVRADQQPVIYVDDYMAPVVEAAALNWDAFDGNMVQFLAASLDTPLHQIQSYIRAAALGPEISQYLELAEGSPVLSVRSTIFTVDNQPVNYSKIRFNSNIVELNIVRMVRTI
ncbi:MAG: GntR family transcriptional regulator [Chloroflexota bacterium]|nr:GntR family transcriptional regulator [Chloroflexota bacterium]